MLQLMLLIVIVVVIGEVMVMVRCPFLHKSVEHSREVIERNNSLWTSQRSTGTEAQTITPSHKHTTTHGYLDTSLCGLKPPCNNPLESMGPWSTSDGRNALPSVTLSICELCMLWIIQLEICSSNNSLRSLIFRVVIMSACSSLLASSINTYRAGNEK